jgi:hypothetical protein
MYHSLSSGVILASGARRGFVKVACLPTGCGREATALLAARPSRLPDCILAYLLYGYPMRYRSGYVFCFRELIRCFGIKCCVFSNLVGCAGLLGIGLLQCYLFSTVSSGYSNSFEQKIWPKRDIFNKSLSFGFRCDVSVTNSAVRITKNSELREGWHLLAWTALRPRKHGYYIVHS